MPNRWRLTIARKLALAITAIVLLCLGTMVNRAGTVLVPFLAMYLQDRLGLDIEFATRALGVFSLGSMVAGLAGGQLADRVGRTAVTIGAMAISATCAATMGWLGSASITVLVTVALIWGVSVIADSAQFSASVTELADAEATQEMLTARPAVFDRPALVVATELADAASCICCPDDPFTAAVFRAALLRSID